MPAISGTTDRLPLGTAQSEESIDERIDGVIATVRYREIQSELTGAQKTPAISGETADSKGDSSGGRGIRTHGRHEDDSGFQDRMADSPTRENTGTYASRPKNLADCLALLRAISPDLALVAERWERLPDALRAGILAMVNAAGR